MRLVDLLLHYRPGSQDPPWNWADETADLWDREPHRMDDLMGTIEAHGMKRPILLGDDGRVWDGHHRVCVAIALLLDEVPVVHV